ncbi:Aldo/keto reductase [Gonapodya prolifera JEL478]|uniref:Aldo/keto reductase n=1 Tax=Gonapodya prolifera (strain JEL478) TaxID=1344416 RepID=A0A139AV82_GONPJ|nr:Aldo/keto reductase [Gonapodya prolifera JEL478]|eukprot:KXS20641.1 Aldo/keto reductase [Gonapodya prolifera JEL478]
MAAWPSYTLSSGGKMPAIGLGTWFGDDATHAQSFYDDLLTAAIDAGYRHFDGAFVYDNEKEIGIAMQKIFASGKVEREDIFWTSKCPAAMQKPERLRYAIEKTLANLQFPYLDLYLIHWPVQNTPIDFPTNCNSKKDADGKAVIDTSFTFKETWAEMEKLVAEGKVKAIGVSNWTLPLLEDLLSYAKIPPAVNQYESHPYLPQPSLLAFCHAHNILPTAYSPLGQGASGLLTDPAVVAVATAHGCTPAQVLINWGVARGCSVIPRTSSVMRVKDNFVMVELTKDEVETIAKVTTRARYADPFDWWGVDLFGREFE